MDSSNKYLKYTSLAFQMIATIGFGAFLGHYLDVKYKSGRHLFTASITLIFVCIALYNAIKSVLNDK